MSLAKILIVDDEQNYARLLKKFLMRSQKNKTKSKHKHYEIELSFELEEALAKIEQILPDVIITDLRLDQELEGLEILDYLKENNLDIPTIIVTAYGNKQNILKCLEKRPYCLFEKSEQFESLNEKIESKLEGILREAKSKTRAKPHLATVRSSLEKLPRSQHLQLLLERLGLLTKEEYDKISDEMQSLRFLIGDDEQKQKQIDKIDRERKSKGLIPLSTINKSNVLILQKSYVSKATGQKKFYPYFLLRSINDRGEIINKYLGKYELISDPLILEKIKNKFSEAELREKGVKISPAQSDNSPKSEI